jgi:hypothetical protein
MFRLKDKHYMTNEKGKVWTVQSGNDAENAMIISEPRKDKVE